MTHYIITVRRADSFTDTFRSREGDFDPGEVQITDTPAGSLLIQFSDMESAAYATGQWVTVRVLKDED